MKIAGFAAVATLTILLIGAAWAQGTTKLPEGWDSKIPLPPGVELVSSSVPKKGAVYSADFKVKGNFKDLMNFYETELPKAGFEMSSKVANPARQVYNRNFLRAGSLDSVVITPDQQDPSEFSLHVAWTPTVTKPVAPKGS